MTRPIVDRLEAALHAPSIYDLTIRLLHRRGFAIDKAVIERDVSRFACRQRQRR